MKLEIDIDMEKYFERLRKSLQRDLFPAEQSLLNLPIVKITIAVLLAVALAMTCGIIHTTDRLEWSFTAEGYVFAAKLFRAPMGVVFLGAPLLALLGSNHKSVQTSTQMALTNRQIELATGQNLFANYYKHFEEFSKWCDHIEGTGAVKSKRKLHKAMYPNAKSGDFSVSHAVVTEFEEYSREMCTVFRRFQGREDTKGHFPMIVRLTESFARKYWLSLTPPGEDDFVAIVGSGDKVTMPSTGVGGFFNEHVKFIRAFDELLSFDSNYESSQLVRSMVSINTSKMLSDPAKFRNFEFMELRGIV